VRFVPGDAELTVAETSAVWEAREAGNQDATLRLTFAPDKARYELDTTVYAAGPTEYWVQIVPEAVYGEGRCLLWVNGNELHSLSADRAFEKMSGLNELRFERAQRTIVIRCNGFELQDRREAGSGLFLVCVIGASGEEARAANRCIEIEVQPARADEVVARRRLVSQVPTETMQVPLDNSGFEDEESFNAWHASSLASADAEVAHGGERSARLDVGGPVEERGEVYITRSVEIEAGHLYRADAWASLQQIVEEIHSLEPLLTADGEIATSVHSPSEGVKVHLWEKRLDDRVLAIAVNRDEQGCELSWEPETQPAAGSARVRFEDRELALAEGQLRDSF